MERRRFEIDAIYISKNRRAPDMARVHSIAESIGDVGLMNPPAVCIRNEVVLDDGEICDAVPVLIYGHHRLLALKQRGEVAVDCIVYDVDDLHAELMEIDENLARAELSPAEEAACILRRKEVWEQIHLGGEIFPTQKATLHKDRPQNQKKFAAEVSAITGEDKSGINRKIARASKLGQDIKRIVGTSLDKGVEMDALIRLPEPERVELIARAEAGEKVSARPPAQPKPMPADKALDVIANGIIAAHSNAPPANASSPVVERADSAKEALFLRILELPQLFEGMSAEWRHEFATRYDLSRFINAYTEARRHGAQ